MSGRDLDFNPNKDSGTFDINSEGLNCLSSILDTCSNVCCISVEIITVTATAKFTEETAEYFFVSDRGLNVIH